MIQLKRQGRDADFATPGEWVRYCKAAAGIPDFEAWGAFVQEHLVSFLVGAKIGDYYWILRQVLGNSLFERLSQQCFDIYSNKIKAGRPFNK